MAQRPYLKDRLIEERPEGFVVITPVDVVKSVPLGCPLCTHVLRTRDDEASFHEFGCCERCSRVWAQSRRQAWSDGWRPTHEQIKASELERPLTPLVFDVD